MGSTCRPRTLCVVGCVPDVVAHGEVVGSGAVDLQHGRVPREREAKPRTPTEEQPDERTGGEELAEAAPEEK